MTPSQQIWEMARCNSATLAPQITHPNHQQIYAVHQPLSQQRNQIDYHPIHDHIQYQQRQNPQRFSHGQDTNIMECTDRSCQHNCHNYSPMHIPQNDHRSYGIPQHPQQRQRDPVNTQSMDQGGNILMPTPRNPGQSKNLIQLNEYKEDRLNHFQEAVKQVLKMCYSVQYPPCAIFANFPYSDQSSRNRK